jgi:probable phosphoglycerate mutase
MKKIYLVRHGESEWNKLKMIQGQSDLPLTDLGRSQAGKIAKRLKSEKIDIIYSSDLKRAVETAQIIGKELNLNVSPDKRLREIDFGPWEGKKNKDVLLKYPKEYTTWLQKSYKFKIDGAETLMEVQNRTMSFVNETLDKNPDKNILIVSHNVAIKSMILGILNIGIVSYNNISLDNVSLTIIEFGDYNKILKLLNDTCHLRED